MDQAQQNRKQQVHHARRRNCSAGIEIDHRGLQLFGAADKRSCGDVREGDDHVKQCDPDEPHHRASGAGAQVFARDLGNRSCAVTYGRGERGEVVHGANQHHTQTDPQQTRQPSECLAGENWSGYWTGGGNR